MTNYAVYSFQEDGTAHESFADGVGYAVTSRPGRQNVGAGFAVDPSGRIVDRLTCKAFTSCLGHSPGTPIIVPLVFETVD